VEALTRAGLRNPVRVAVAVSAAAAAPAVAGGRGGDQGLTDQGAAGSGGEGQVTPATLQLQYVVCEVDEKMGQLVSLAGRLVSWFATGLVALSSSRCVHPLSVLAVFCSPLNRHTTNHQPNNQPTDRPTDQIAFLASHASCKTIVYFLTCACVEHAAMALKRHPLLKGLHTSALHGKLKQAQREATLAAFAEQPAGARFSLLACGLVPWVEVVLQGEVGGEVGEGNSDSETIQLTNQPTNQL
jgi:hypothetical protein